MQCAPRELCLRARSAAYPFRPIPCVCALLPATSSVSHMRVCVLAPGRVLLTPGRVLLAPGRVRARMCGPGPCACVCAAAGPRPLAACACEFYLAPPYLISAAMRKSDSIANSLAADRRPEHSELSRWYCWAASFARPNARCEAVLAPSASLGPNDELLMLL